MNLTRNSSKKGQKMKFKMSKMSGLTWLSLSRFALQEVILLSLLTVAKMTPSVRVLTLELNQDGSSIVYKLQKDWILQFRLGSSLLGQSVDLYTNYPLERGFERSSYSKIEWDSDSNNRSDGTSIYANVCVKTSGSFHFYIQNSR